jgi:hypothetical protein
MEIGNNEKMEIKRKKAQIISFDFSTSFIIFLIFIVIFIGLIFFSNNTEKKDEFELDYVFANLENNLRHYSVPDRDFFVNYRISKTKLENFASDFDMIGIDSFVVGNLAGTHGIGLDDEAYDVCMYFTDNDNSHIVLSAAGKVALGQLGNIGKSCNDQITDPTKPNPCESYSQAISLFKPVLFDEGDNTKNRIVQMNLVMCRK